VGEWGHPGHWYRECQRFFNRLLQLLESRPQQGRRMIGLGAPALWGLWQRIQIRVDGAEVARRHRLGRKRQAGGGQTKATLALSRLLVTLLSLRQPWTMAAMGEVIDCSEATVWNYIHEMLPYLRAELPASLLEQWQAECNSVERAELETWLAELPEGALLVDTWEQPMPRPEDQAVQASYYSGNQKEHTRKNQLICLPGGADVEHLIRVIKIFRIAKEEFRMRAAMYEMVIGCVCGLVRLRGQYA
jgi:hypothetical protein